MKRFLWLSVMAATMMSASCQNQEMLESEFDQIEAVAEIPVEVDGFTALTRSVVNETDTGIEMFWATSESIGVYGTGLKNAEFVSTNKYQQQASAYFSGAKLFTSPKYAYYPYSKENSSNDMTAVRGSLPSDQWYSTVHRKMNTDYKIGVYASRSWLSYKFSFSHLLTFARFKVNADGTVLADEELQRVSIEVTTADGAPRQINGGFTMDITKPNTTAVTSWDVPEEDGNKITLRFNDTPVLAAGETIVGYASVAPMIQIGDIITFEVVTDKHIAKFSRPSKAAFTANGLINYPLTLANFSDMTVEEIPAYVPDTPSDDPLADLTDATPVLKSLKFEVDKNPGKILARKFKHNSSFTVSTSTVNEEVCTIDDTNRKVTLYVPYLNDRKLVPTFEIPEGTALVYEGGIVESGVTEIDFSVYKQIAVINGNEEVALYDVELTNTGLPIVVVNQETGVTSTESNSSYSKASAAWYAATGTKWQPKDADWGMTEGVDNFMIYNPDGTSALVDKGGATVTEAVLSSTRVRGNVTQQMPKKPFAVKLDKKHGINIRYSDGATATLPAHKRWVLLANWKDRTLMRNAVAFGIADVFSQTFPDDGMEWNPSGEFVELVYNGVHVGTYYLCEQIKIDENRLDINDPYDVDDGYSGNPADYGYLLESDDGYDETWKFTTACYVPFLFKDDGHDDMLAYAQDFVRGIEDQLYAGNYSAAYEKMDLTSFVDFWLVQELMMNSETKHPKSCYSYINDGKMYAGPIWDFDWNTLPVSSDYSEESYTFTASMLSAAKAYHKRSGYPGEPLAGGGWFSQEDKNYIWYPMLVKDATFTALAAERWNAVKGALSSFVDVQIPAIMNRIAKSEAENSKMWPVDSDSSTWSKRYSTYGIGGGFCGDEGKSFSDAVSTMQSTLESRINGMNYVSNQSWPSVSYSSK